jgi:hypothetical protein
MLKQGLVFSHRRFRQILPPVHTDAQLFESMFRKIVKPNDPCLEMVNWASFVEGYRIKAKIAAFVAPQHVVELGVRAGYSAWAIMTACHATYIGYDAYNGQHGGGTMRDRFKEWAEYILSSLSIQHTIIVQNTQHMKDLPSAEFYHIDADHTKSGVIHDIDLCFSAAPVGACILIDDYDFIPDVRSGIDLWRSTHTNSFAAYVHTYRGDIIIIKGKTTPPSWLDSVGGQLI